MEKCVCMARQREKAVGESFHVCGSLVAPEPIEGNVGPSARVRSMRVRGLSCEFRWYRGIDALSNWLGAFLILSV